MPVIATIAKEMRMRKIAVIVAGVVAMGAPLVSASPSLLIISRVRPMNMSADGNVIIGGSVPNDEAKKLWPEGWKEPKPYIRIVPQPKD